jgi:cytoskeletal protein CcmA (bactofilin family)
VNRGELPLAALLGKDASYSGELRFDGRVRVDGRFDGKIYTADLLEIGESGHVSGEIDAARLHVSGTCEGTLHVSELLVVTRTGAIRGKVDAVSMQVEPGAKVDAVVKAGA